VAWSLGVLDTLASIHTQGDRQLAGLVLVDNSVGEEPAPIAHAAPPHRRTPPSSRAEAMRQFVRAMFEHPQPPDYVDRLTETCLRTPDYASRALLAYPVPRTYWREAVYATHVPVLYVVRPRWAEQGENLMRYRGNTELEVFPDAGHALFVDEPGRFNQVVDSFLRRHVWP
jgi:microsomal epoxide hydrolase